MFVGAAAVGASRVSFLPPALGYNMSHFLAPKTPDNPTAVWAVIMENGHLHSSLSARWEWDYGPNNSGCFDKGGVDRGVAGPYGDWVGKAEMAIKIFIHVANLQPLFTEVELSLNSHKLLRDLHNPPLSVLHQPLQRILEVAQASLPIDFPMVLGVINLGEYHVDGKFPLTPIPQMPPFDRGHRGVSGDPPINLDGA